MSLLCNKKCQIRVQKEPLCIFELACVSWYTVHGCHYIFGIHQKIYLHRGFLQGVFLPHAQALDLRSTVHEMGTHRGWYTSPSQGTMHAPCNFRIASPCTGMFLGGVGNQRIQRVWTGTWGEHTQNSAQTVTWSRFEPVTQELWGGLPLAP